MRPIQLSDNLQDIRTQEENRSQEAAIHGEIARRMLDLRELVGELRATSFHEKTMAIYHVQPSAYWMLMHLFTGDLSEITKSYTEQGRELARTKQATQQELERDISAIGRHYPLLAQAVLEIRSITAKLAP